jgi:hypothetical protein
MLAVSATANNGETVTIGNVSYDNGIPVDGSITAGAGQSFESLLINSDIPITEVQYTVIPSTPSTWERDPTSLVVMSGFPTIQAVPEPGVITLILTGGSLALMLFKRKK